MSPAQKYQGKAPTQPMGAWARRKAGVKAEMESLARQEDEKLVAQERAALAEKTDAEILKELDLPDPDDMKAGDDFAAFMKAAIPERLRRRALRKLWLSDPVLANVDGLLDYGDDFTDASCVEENMKTAYQVGKGMLKHVEEMERQKEAAENATAETVEPEAVEEAETPPELGEPADAAVLSGDTNPTPVVAETEREFEDPEDAPQPFVRRKMRFAFAE